MKYFEDDVYSNKYMAKVGGISTREVLISSFFFLVLLSLSLFLFCFVLFSLLLIFFFFFSFSFFFFFLFLFFFFFFQLSVLERLHLVMLKFSLMMSPVDYGNFCKEAVRLEGQILLDSVPTKGKKGGASELSNAIALIARLLPPNPNAPAEEKEAPAKAAGASEKKEKEGEEEVSSDAKKASN